MSGVTKGFRLSPQQRRLWQLQREGLAHRSQYVLRLEGIVGPGALLEALRRTVSRHEILRTRFRSLPGVNFPIQVIDAGAGLDWRAIDWGGAAAEDEDMRFAELFASEERRPEASEYESPLRATL